MSRIFFSDDEFFAALREAIVIAGSCRRLSLLLKVNKNCLNNWLYKKTKPTASSRMKLEQFLIAAKINSN